MRRLYSYQEACWVCAGARESVRFLPPLTVSEGEIAEALSIFGDCLEEVFGISHMEAASA